MKRLETNSIILIAGNIISKVLFLIFLYYLAYDTKQIGLEYYTIPYIPFSIFLDLSSFGIIPGISRLIAKTEGNKRNHILRVGTIYSLMLGFLFTGILNLLKNIILDYSINAYFNNEQIEAINTNLAIASITLFIYPVIAFYKGFLQGTGKMLSTSLSLVFESSLRLILYFLLRRSIESYSDIKYVYIINIAAYIIAFIPLFGFIIKYFFYKYEKTNSLALIIKGTIPFGIVTLFFTFYQLIDSLTLEALGVSSEIYTAYLFESIRLIYIPISIFQAIGSILNPKITTMREQGKYEEAALISKKITKFIIFMAIPIIFIYCFYSETLYTSFYHKNIEENVLANVAILIIFVGFYKALIGLCSSLNKFSYIIITTFISILSKISLNYILIPRLDYRGSIISSVIAITICIIVSYYILKKNGIKILSSNLRSILFSFLFALPSFFIAVLFRVNFPISKFPLLIEMLLFSIVFLGIYYVIFRLSQMLTIYGKKHII